MTTYSRNQNLTTVNGVPVAASYSEEVHRARDGSTTVNNKNSTCTYFGPIPPGGQIPSFPVPPGFPMPPGGLPGAPPNLMAPPPNPMYAAEPPPQTQVYAPPVNPVYAPPPPAQEYAPPPPVYAPPPGTVGQNVFYPGAGPTVQPRDGPPSFDVPPTNPYAGL